MTNVRVALAAMSLMTMAVACLAGCRLGAAWPDRAGRSPEQMLADVVRWQQSVQVKESTGELAHACFTWVDLHAFADDQRPESIANRLKTAPGFAEVTTALRGLPREQMAEALRSASMIARPTWRMMGFIDPSGAGQTEAGHIADSLVAAAITDAFAAALAMGPPVPSTVWRAPDRRGWPQY